jgi:hypothetical protein
LVLPYEMQDCAKGTLRNRVTKSTHPPFGFSSSV